MKKLVGVTYKFSGAELEKPIKINEDEIIKRFDSINSVKLKACYLFLLNTGNIAEKLFVKPLLKNLKINPGSLPSGRVILREFETLQESDIQGIVNSVAKYEDYKIIKYILNHVKNKK